MDNTDGVYGIPKIGIVKAQKYLDQMVTVNSDTITYENWVLDAYINHYGTSQGIYEFQKNYRLLHMLNCNEDFMREVGEIPMMPQVREVIRDSQIENKEFNLENLNF